MGGFIFVTCFDFSHQSLGISCLDHQSESTQRRQRPALVTTNLFNSQSIANQTVSYAPISAPRRFDMHYSALEPLVTGPLLLGLLYYPEQALVILPPNAQSRVESAAFVSTVKVLLRWEVVRRINNFLSRVVLNNFTGDVWKTGKEIVVVTGASNGMGAAIAREVAKNSASVIALDLYPPAQPFRK
jgi:hypothetical protein